jgi:transcriptional regulator with XRE-family HTH domain
VPKSVHTTVYRELIDRLIAARTKAGLTQKAVADRLGKPQSYVAKVEGLERRLDVVEFLRLAVAIDWDPLPAIKTARIALGDDLEQ